MLTKVSEMKYEGVSGVMCIESGKPGPILGITACTHGNEPSGLSVFDYLLKEKNIEKELQCGTLYLVVNNLKAADSFFQARTEDEVLKSRYRDINMNRLPRNVLELVGDARYEVQRTQELYPIWKRFTHGLDIHSTTAPTDPMIISRGGVFHPKLVKGFSIDNLISNIDRVQIGTPAFVLYGDAGEDIPVFAIEAGQHTQPATFERAAQCAISLLQNLGMLPGVPSATIHEYNEYYIDGSFVFPDTSFDLIQNFRSYDAIEEGEILARNTEGEEIKAPFNGHLIMPTSRRGLDKDISEEVAFISLPVKLRQV